MANQNHDENKNQKRRGALIGQGALAAGVATAVLLGGFGAFSLWNDSLGAGVSDNIATGKLTLDNVSTGAWTITKTDGVLPVNSTINPATFKASPGDVLQYATDVKLTAHASDMLAQLVIDPTTFSIDPALASGVTVQLAGPNGATGTIPVDARITGQQDIPVTVTVTFSDSITGKTGQDLASAVSLTGLNFKLEQIAGS